MCTIVEHFAGRTGCVIRERAGYVVVIVLFSFSYVRHPLLPVTYSLPAVKMEAAGFSKTSETTNTVLYPRILKS